MVKTKSQQNRSGSSKTGTVVVTAEDAEKLADELADKQYGKPKIAEPESEPIERLTIALPISMYDDIEALAKKRKRAKMPDRSMAAITRAAIKEYLSIHSD